MITNQLELEKERLELRERASQVLPGLWDSMTGVIREVYKEGALDTKTKRLMSLAVALGVGCKNCILAQTQYALEQGATKEEILETLGVVVSMRGTTGFGESLRVLQLLDEQKKL
jgi:AhpD family alkylhydroperoxidase